MKKDIIINVSFVETRIAILENNTLTELYFELAENERMVGDIYYGKVAKVVRGMQAAFINIGQKQDAFLHFSDIGENFSYYKELFEDKYSKNEQKGKGHKRNTNDQYLKVGQPILVQITKEPMANKGARVTTNISLPGRLIVLIPFDRMVGVSRKIYKRREKYRLKQIGRKIRPDGFGLVMRTVSEGKEEKAFRSDLTSALKVWTNIRKAIKKNNPPSLVYKDMGMLSSVVRDLFTPDINKLVVDSKKLHSQIVKYLRELSPQLVDRVELYQKKEPIFDFFGIESEVNKSLTRKVWLKSGGYIFIDHTEALTAIDVNSGRFLGKRDHDANSLRINLEAAAEIARQLRLRDIGGIIIIDFIDMVEENNRKKLQQEFNRELRKDRSQVNVTPLSIFGIIEMTRQRVRSALLISISESCPACMGTGRVINKSTMVAKFERWLKRYRSKAGERSLQIMLHPELAKFFTEGYRSRLRRLSWKYWTRVKVMSNENMSMDDFRVFDKMGEQDLTDKFMP